MENYSLVRIAARGLRSKIDPDLAELSANTIVSKALSERNLTLEKLPAVDSTLAGVWASTTGSTRWWLSASILMLPTRLEVIAHEIGHDVVH